MVGAAGRILETAGHDDKDEGISRCCFLAKYQLQLSPARALPTSACTVSDDTWNNNTRRGGSGRWYIMNGVAARHVYRMQACGRGGILGRNCTSQDSEFLTSPRE